MVMPILSPPVKRSNGVDPTAIIDPASCVDLVNNPADIQHVMLELIFGANYNDPAAFRTPGYRQVMRSARGRRG